MLGDSKLEEHSQTAYRMNRVMSKPANAPLRT